MKIGICEWTMPISGPYVCKFAKELGYDGIQLFGGDYEKRFPISRKVTQDAYLEMAAEHGIEFASIAVRVTDYFSMFAPEGSEEHHIVRMGITKAVDAAAAMDVSLVMIPNFVKSQVRSAEDFRRLVQELSWACDYAADAGVVIAEENFMTVADTERLFDAVGRVNLRLYFDLQNYYLNAGMHTPDLIEPLLPYIVQVHAKDGKNKDLSGAPLGEGDVHLLDSVSELRRLGYSGWMVNENYYDVPPLVGEEDDPVAALKKDIATLRRVCTAD
ncbi:MAG: sugar phosphate isomerase/epimerase [Spirochaeta sp.]|nr:sugar phosphate isomerase/epimerase [Spirochaeta sp.]